MQNDFDKIPSANGSVAFIMYQNIDFLSQNAFLNGNYHVQVLSHNYIIKYIH